MRRTDRLFELVQLFRGGRLWRGQDLAERLEVSLRTLYRDIDTLVASGVPIEGERGVGYILREPIFLPPLTMTHLELEALQLGMRMVTQTGDPELSDAARQLQDKIEAVLPSDRKQQDYSKLVSLLGPHPKGEHTHLPALRDAIRNSYRLTLDYQSLDDRKSQRVIRPLHLEYWGRVWTLTTWCELRQDFRAFRVDRIKATTPGEPFSSEPGKTFEDFLARLKIEMAAKGRPLNDEGEPS